MVTGKAQQVPHRLLCLSLFSRNHVPSILSKHRPQVTMGLLPSHMSAAPCAAVVCQLSPASGLQWLLKNLGQSSKLNPVLRLYGVCQQPLPLLILRSSNLISLPLPRLTAELLWHPAHTRSLLRLYWSVMSSLHQITVPIWFLTCIPKLNLYKKKSYCRTTISWYPCEVRSMLTSLILVTISKCIHIPKHQVACLKYVQFLFVN